MGGPHEELSNRISHQHDHRKDTQHRPKGHENALHPRHDETEQVMPPLREEPTGCQHEACEDPAQSDEQASENHKYPSDKGRRRRSLATELLRREDEHQAEDEMKNRDQGEECRDTGNHVVEYRKQPELVLIFGHPFSLGEQSRAARWLTLLMTLRA